jgi:hypothetical protein
MMWVMWEYGGASTPPSKETPAMTTFQTTIEGFDAWGKRHAWKIRWAPQDTEGFQPSSAPGSGVLLWGSEDNPPARVVSNNFGGVRVVAPPHAIDGIVFAPRRIKSGTPTPGEFILSEA